MTELDRVPTEELKSCCANLYASDWARTLLGDSFHPGGLVLTERLGTHLNLGPSDRVLDVACGNGTSAIFLAQRFGCSVVGFDYSGSTVDEARARAREAGPADRVRFQIGDAELLPVGVAQFDALICECAFCSFPDKPTAAAEFARVVRPGSQVGLSDLTRAGSLPDELGTLLGWVACLGDARPVEEYIAYLGAAGYGEPRIEMSKPIVGPAVAGAAKAGIVKTRLISAPIIAPSALKTPRRAPSIK